jgi:hypothetical protein
MLTNSIAEPDTTIGEVVWTSATYAVGDKRIVVSTHRTYQCAVAGLRTISPDLDTANWVDIGPTNKWAMFDILRATTSNSPSGTITVTLNPGQLFNSVAVMQLTAQTVTISASSVLGGGIVYTKTLNLQNRKPTGWYDYYFSDIEFKQNTAVFGILEYSDLIVTITISNGTSTVYCGGIVIGRAQDLGYTQLGCASQALNFSTITRDTFGNAQVVQRRSVPKTTQTVIFEHTEIDRLEYLRDLLNAVPAVWSGLDDQTDDNYFDAFLIMGIYRDFTIRSDNVYSTLNLELEEV